jgi:predicted HicB family RNase H-like nuclease
MDNLKYKGYAGTVEYNATNNCLFGKVEGMVKDSITYEGQSINELKTDFENAIDSYLEGCEELGIKPRKAYSGSLNIRIPSEIHCHIALKAKQTGRSINAIIKDALETQLNLPHD